MTLAAISDISVRKRLELELRQANANLEEFTYVASHDLRSPLRGIADLVEWITEDLGDSDLPKVRRNLDRVSTAHPAHGPADG
jgi:light-regulated signal transduction histidine kinase (bacteriophytochrome)